MPPQSGDADRVACRRADVARLYCRGWPQHKIAEKYHVTRQQISKDLIAVRRQWQREMVASFDRHKAEQLAKIDAVEAEAWRGWRRSLRDAESVKEKAAVIPGGEKDGAAQPATVIVTERKSDREGQAGDPRFLTVIDTCIDRRLKVIGGYAEKGTGEAPPTELVIRVLGPGLSVSELLGGSPLHARGALPAN